MGVVQLPSDARRPGAFRAGVVDCDGWSAAAGFMERLVRMAAGGLRAEPAMGERVVGGGHRGGDLATDGVDRHAGGASLRLGAVRGASGGGGDPVDSALGAAAAD